MNWKTHVYALGALAAVVLVVYGSVLFPLRSLTANDAPVASIALGRQWAAQGRTVVEHVADAWRI